MIKASYKTSEFWFTLVSFIFSGLYLTGVIQDSALKDGLISGFSHAVESIILIAGQSAIVYKYINSRKEIKKKVIEKEEVELLNDKPRSKRTSKPRISKSSGKKPRNSKNS
jgi:hypothetical protein